MLKVCWVTKVKMFFLEPVYVFNSNLSEFSASILEKGLLDLVSYNSGSNRAPISNRPRARRVLKFLARLLPKLYSIRSNNTTNQLPDYLSITGLRLGVYSPIFNKPSLLYCIWRGPSAINLFDKARLIIHPFHKWRCTRKTWA